MNLQSKRWQPWLLLGPMLLGAMLIGGCATRPAPESAGPGVDPAAPPKVQHRLQNPAVVALWQQAETARQQQQLEVAANAIERALRIEPADPVLWSRLAELRLETDQWVQAENLAAKSNALAADNPTLRYRNWLIIGASRQKRDDLDGAREAQIESERLFRAIQSGR